MGACRRILVIAVFLSTASGMHAAPSHAASLHAGSARGGTAPDRASMPRIAQIAALFTHVTGSPAPSAFGSDAYPIAGGDLDGDGLPDVLVQAGARSSAFTLTALKGSDGTTLWTRTIATADGAYNVAVPFRLGAATSGALVISTPGPNEVDLWAVDAGGNVAWSRRDTGSSLPLIQSKMPQLFDVLHVAGGADRVMEGLTSSIDVATLTTLDRFDLDVIDGSDGSVVETVRRSGTDTQFRALSLGDLNGSGYDDFAIVSAQSSPAATVVTVSAYRGADATPRWTATTPTFAFGDSFLPAGDVTGDGVGDLVHLAIGNPMSSLELYNGSNGTLVWSKPASNGFPMGDADGDGRSDVMALTATYGSTGTTVDETIVAQAINGAGTVLYATTHELSYPLSGSSPCTYFQDAGDVNGDGAHDAMFQAMSDCRYGIPAQGGVISGRGGGVLWTRANAGVPLRASIDGDGMDLALLAGGSTTAVTAIDGATGAVIWTLTLAQPSYGSAVSAFAIDLDGDGKADVVPQDTTVTAVSGGTGSALWSRS